MTKITIRKRNGKKANFDMQKIVSAAERAFESVGKKMPATFRSLLNQNNNRFVICGSVENIQDHLGDLLLTCGYTDVYKEFTRYRDKRAALRELKSKTDFESIINLDKNDITNDNANMNAESPAGMMMKFASETTKSFSKKYLLSDEVVEAMNNNWIYVHDLDYYPTRSLTCVQTPLDKILENGFTCGHGSARPAKRIETAAILTAISMETTQNEQHGGQSIPAFDFYMAPYVRKTYIEEVRKIWEVMGESNIKELYEAENSKFDDYIRGHGPNKISNLAIANTISRVHQSMESLIHNLNSIHSRGGNQVVFSSLNYGTDISAEGRLVIRELLKCTYQGVGKGSTAIFPIQIMKLKNGVNKNPGDPNYDLYQESWKVTARRFFPNYLNLDASYNVDPLWDPNDPKRYIHEVATMGCRTRVYSDKFGEYPTSIGRGNLSFTSLNLPKFAIEAGIKAGTLIKTENGYEHSDDGDTDQAIRIFFDTLDHYAYIVAKQLDERYKFQSQALKAQFPLLMSGIWMDSDNLQNTDTIESVIQHGTLGVSFIGIAEALIALVGKHQGESDEAQRLGLKIVEFLKQLCDEFSTIFNHNYSCFATPAEGLSGRFTIVDRKKYGIIQHITDKDYYTNSSHVPVWYHCTPTHKARIEGPYHKFENAGHIFYVECDADITKNPEAVDSIVRIACENDCGYISINHTQGRCEDCGHESNDPDLHRFGSTCPVCGGKWSTLDRVTGYLSSTYNKQAFGKAAEILDRVNHVTREDFY